MPFEKPNQTNDVETLAAKPMDLDALLQELNTPRQDFTPPPEANTTGAPGFWQTDASRPEIPISPPVSPEEAIKQGRHAAKMLDTGISFALKMFAHDDSAEHYKASDEEISEMAEPLSELSEKYNFKISPEIVLLFLVITIYMPKYFVASERRQQALEHKQKDLEQRIKRMEKADESKPQ